MRLKIGNAPIFVTFSPQIFRKSRCPNRYMRFLLLSLLVLPQSLWALTIKIDDTYDANNFFDTAVKRDAIESVAKFYGDLIKDNLLRIDPADFLGCSWVASIENPQGGNKITLPDLVVPADTQSFAGSIKGAGASADFAQISGTANTLPWKARVTNRGNVGASTTPATDFAPWGGSISFDFTGP
jgi:hypothetical protein